MKGLRAELDRVGIRGRLAARIEAELDDHLACDPDADLGTPRLIAQRFADELRLPKTRRATHLAVVALALTAAGLVLQTAARSVPDLGGAAGIVVPLAGLAIVLGAQVAFVGGILALWGAHRGTTAAVVQRRSAVALAAGALVVVGEAVDASLVSAPVWWYLLAVPALGLPALALAAAGASLRTVSAFTPGGGTGAVRFARNDVVAVGAAAVVLVVVGSAFAEHSWNEGLTRGAFEAVAFVGCFVALGRGLGIRR